MRSPISKTTHGMHLVIKLQNMSFMMASPIIKSLKVDILN
jgi:hypothetical protein